MMCDADEDEVENLLEDFVSEKIIQKISDDEYRYIGKIKSKENYLKLIEPEKENPSKIIPEITFKTASKYFLEHHAMKNCTPSTFKSYKSLIKSHLIQFFGRKMLAEISNDDIKAFVELKQQQNLKNKRLRNCVTLLGSMFEKFKEWNFVEKSPYYGIKNIQYSKVQKVYVLDNVEVDNILEKTKLKSSKLYLFVLLILSTGLKKSEIFPLKKEDINFRNNKIIINKTLCEGTFLPSKIREADIPSEIIYKLEKIMKRKRKDDYIFYDKRFSSFTIDQRLRRMFVIILKELNLPCIGFNDLRHTYAYNALQSGMSIEYLHKQLGDYSIQATMDRYRDFIVS